MFKKAVILSILFIGFIFPSFQTSASDKSSDDVKNAEVSEAQDVDINAVPPILDPNYRHRKKHQFEFAPYGGAYLGNAIGQTWLIGTKVSYWLNNTVALGANYSYSRLLTNRGSPFGSILTDSNMQAINGQIVLTNDAALRVGDKLLELDFYMTLGMGSMYLNKTWELMGEIGGGVKFYTGIPWLAFRIDVDNYVHNVSQPGRDVIDFDFIISGGVSFLFPTNPSAYEKK